MSQKEPIEKLVRCYNLKCQIIFPESNISDPMNSAIRKKDDEFCFCGRACYNDYYNLPMEEM